MKRSNFEKLIAGDLMISKLTGQVELFHERNRAVYIYKNLRLHPDTRARLRALDAQQAEDAPHVYLPGELCEVRCTGGEWRVAAFICIDPSGEPPTQYRRAMLLGAYGPNIWQPHEIRPVTVVPGAVVMDRQTGRLGEVVKDHNKRLRVRPFTAKAAHNGRLVDFNAAQHAVMMRPGNLYQTVKDSASSESDESAPSRKPAEQPAAPAEPSIAERMETALDCTPRDLAALRQQVDALTATLGDVLSWASPEMPVTIAEAARAALGNEVKHG